MEISREDVSRVLVVALGADGTSGQTYELAAGDETIEDAFQAPVEG